MSIQATVRKTESHGSGDATVPGHYLSFALAGHLYAVPLAQVVEITPAMALNRIPHLPRNVEGLLDHRGQMIPVVGLRGRMNLDPLEAGVSSNIVVLDQGGGRLGIVVDTVEAVVSAAPGQIEPAGTLLAGPQGAWVAGFFLQGDRVIALLDSGFLASLHHLS